MNNKALLVAVSYLLSQGSVSKGMDGIERGLTEFNNVTKATPLPAPVLSIQQQFLQEISADHDDTQKLLQLIEAGAKPNDTSSVPSLVRAAKSGRENKLNFLLAHRALANQKDPDGISALTHVLINGGKKFNEKHMRMLRSLIAAGAWPKEQTQFGTDSYAAIPETSYKQNIITLFNSAKKPHGVK